MAKRVEIVPFVSVPCGLMPCVACSDFKKRPGTMWLGYSRTGDDLTIDCPVCRGTGQVERLKQIDIRTGREIDYEKPGQKFVQTGSFETPVEPQASSRIILTT